MALLKRVKSSSMLETVIAMVIIMLVFGISIMIYINITSSNYSLQRIKADLLIQQLSIQTEEKKSYFDEVIPYEVLTVEKQVQKYQDSDDILLVTLSVYNQQKDTIARKEQLILVKQDD